jgi:hypothetical protein
MNKLLPLLRDWKSNGRIHPLIRSWDECDWVIDNTQDKPEVSKREARSWARIAMEHTLKHLIKPTYTDVTNASSIDGYFDLASRPFWDIPSPSYPWSPWLKTIAQMVAKHGGTNSRAKCHDVWDLKQCIELVGDYNDHKWRDSVRAVGSVNRMRVYPDQHGRLWNPNDGGDLYDWEIAWEGSHAIYCRASGGVHHSGSYERGIEVVDEQVFRNDMENAREICHPDEFNIKITPTSYHCRMWWD